MVVVEIVGQLDLDATNITCPPPDTAHTDYFPCTKRSYRVCMPHKVEYPLTAYFSRVTTTPKQTQPHKNLKRGALEEDLNKGHVIRTSAKKHKANEEDAIEKKRRKRDTAKTQRRERSSKDPSHECPTSMTLPEFRFSARDKGKAIFESNQAGTASASAATLARPFKPPSVRISTTTEIIDLGSLQDEEYPISPRNSEEFVPSSQTQELDYDYGFKSSSTFRRVGTDSAKPRSARKITFADSIESIIPDEIMDDYVASSQSQSMLHDETSSAITSSRYTWSPLVEPAGEIIPSSQTQWDPNVEVSEDLLADTTMVPEVNESADDARSMRRSISPLCWKDVEVSRSRSRSRSPPDPIDLQEPSNSNDNDTPAPNREHLSSAHVPSSPSGSVHTFSLSQAEVGFSQVDSGSSLPSVVKDFRDMFDDEGSYPIDFPMSLRF